MSQIKPYFINFSGQLVSLEHPKVMGILNVTPDSFYAPSRQADDVAITQRVEEIVSEGASIIDIGACSTRPGAVDVPIDEEMRRLRKGLDIIRKSAPEIPVSVDTYRADVATMCVEEYGASMINDISAGEMDKQMFDTIARLNVPYIIMHMQGRPQTMQDSPQYNNLIGDVFLYFANKIDQLHELGVKDVIVDPGFGFGKTLRDNYLLMHHLEEFHQLDCPLLVGVSRKSMIYKKLGCTENEALNGTTVLNTIALNKGAHLLRVHDVKAACEAIKLWQSVKNAPHQSF